MAQSKVRIVEKLTCPGGVDASRRERVERPISGVWRHTNHDTVLVAVIWYAQHFPDEDIKMRVKNHILITAETAHNGEGVNVCPCGSAVCRSRRVPIPGEEDYLSMIRNGGLINLACKIKCGIRTVSKQRGVLWWITRT
jgi:hypothetical protein